VNSRSGVWDRAPAENEFGAFYFLQNPDRSAWWKKNAMHLDLSIGPMLLRHDTNEPTKGYKLKCANKANFVVWRKFQRRIPIRVYKISLKSFQSL